ncbi:alpha/beta hydrolase [Lentzea sp.]|uniref:alpha/beta fold hydrolase n=1 Tax=Lentzea sp. TaxID=56099 RepID=UPI002ED04207
MVALREITTNGVELNVAVTGDGPALVLLHGFPHTWQLWEPVIPALAEHHTVVAPDLRGLGASSRPDAGYSAGEVSADVIGLLDALGVERADVVAIDLGVAPAFLTGLEHPDRVRRLVLMEGLAGALPGAEDFLRAGPPWWFGFHAVPGLAEAVLAGHEPEYFDFFLQAGTAGDGVTPRFRSAVHEAYRGTAALRAAFEHYRALPDSARQIAEAVGRRRLTVPALAVGAAPVGEATRRQVELVGDDVRGVVLAGCGHIIPQHRPRELLAVLGEFLR